MNTRTRRSATLGRSLRRDGADLNDSRAGAGASVIVTHMQPMAPGKKVEVFFDGECPLCAREIGMLRRLDRRGRIRFTDIAAAGFDATALGRSMSALMDRIHGRLPDGTWIEGVEVFRRLYAAVGLGVLVAPTKGCRQQAWTWRHPQAAN